LDPGSGGSQLSGHRRDVSLALVDTLRQFDQAAAKQPQLEVMSMNKINWRLRWILALAVLVSLATVVMSRWRW
jgi:hypothetical protein